MTSKLKTDILETGSGSGTIALNNQLSGMTTASLPTLTSAVMPSGSTLQYIRVNMTTAPNSTSTTFFDIGSIAITPISNNSTLVITVCSGSSEAGNFSLHRVWNNDTSVSAGDWQQGGWQGQAAQAFTHTLSQSNTRTTATTFKYQGKVDNGTGYFNYSNPNPYLSITEIKN